MRTIYISPHLDDAVLSAGGYLYEQAQDGISVEIWTIVCGYPPPGELTPFAQLLHQEWKTGTPEETVHHRRIEDKKAARIVGAKSVHFDVPDCIYRRGPDGEPLYQDIYVQPHDTEAGLVDQIAESIKTRLDSGDQIICQLGVGGHVDHVIVRGAVEKLNRPLKYTADVPYLFKQPETLAPLVTEMDEFLFPITEAGMEAWIEAVRAHASQLSTLFESETEMESEIRAYYDERNGFPLWR